MELQTEPRELETPEAVPPPRLGLRLGRRAAWLGGLLALAVAGYLLAGVFTVAADEQAVIRRFGRVAARLGPGIHYRLPWPIDQVDIVKTTSVMKTGVGFDLRDGEERVTGVEILTGDTNIISVAMTLQYVIRNPSAFLFETENPSTLIGSLAESVLTETVLGMPVDEVLTTGRLAIQEQVKTRTQEILDRYDSGVQITSANMMGITLDSAVAQAFQDVANASADRENKINQGRSYANDLLPKARGEARSIVLAAQSYREQRVAEAIGHRTHGGREPINRKVGIDGAAVCRFVTVQRARLGRRGLGSKRRLCLGRFRAHRQSRALEQFQHTGHVRPRLRVRWNAAVTRDCVRARVVRREREGEVAVVAVDEVPQVPGATLDVLARVEDVADPEQPRRLRHELHQAARALRRDCARLKVRLHADDGFDEL